MALPPCFRPVGPHASIGDPDAVVVAAERDPIHALQMIIETMRPKTETIADWPDSLAGAIIAGDLVSLNAWAAQNRLHPASLARGFHQIYGAAPCTYRLELRSRNAWKLIVDTDQPLGTIAHQLGFSDQAHMSRCVKRLTGQSPGQWRKLKSFKTAAA